MDRRGRVDVPGCVDGPYLEHLRSGARHVDSIRRGARAVRLVAERALERRAGLARAEAENGDILRGQVAGVGDRRVGGGVSTVQVIG